MSTSDTATNCPFCGFIPAGGEYGILLHIETHHAESPSPFVAAEESILCPHGGCGELVSPDELPYHLELHGLEEGEEEGEEAAVEVAAVAATTTAAESTAPPENERSSRSSRPTRESSSRSRKSAKRPTGTIQAWRDLFEGHRSRQTRDSARRTRHKSKTHVDTKSSEPAAPASATAISPAQAAESSQQFARLGKSELGRYAHEKEMPDWLVSLLKHEGQVVNKGIMPVLAQLLEQSPSTQYAYLCHRHVQHISKLRREGGFCGYRNIQMLTSHVIGARSAGAEKFGSTFPSIFQVQDLIENAWDMGYNAQGRIETGGIKGTRKYIGTPEAQAVFCSLGIPCTVQAFKDRERGKAKSHLLQAVEQYFQGGVEDPEDRIHLTRLPPIYLQHPGHSLTIVGFEKQMDGRTNLLVFDPSFRDSVTIRNLVGRFFRHKPATVGETLDPYRRGSSYLRRFNAFEVLFLTSNATA